MLEFARSDSDGMAEQPDIDAAQVDGEEHCRHGQPQHDKGKSADIEE